MPASEETERLTTLFKALGDASRFRMVGLLADQPHSVEELAASLGISSPTVSHHLHKLQAAGLVEARALQYYNVYALRPDTLQWAARALRSPQTLKTAAESLDRSSYAKKVEQSYFVRGRLKSLPVQVRKRQVVLNRLAQAFQTGKHYPKHRVNEILAKFHSDPEMLRNALVSAKLLTFEEGSYRRTELHNTS